MSNFFKYRPEKFGFETGTSRHQKESKEDEKFHCSTCRKTFNNMFDIAKHDVRRHGILVTCFFCDKQCETVEALSQHTKDCHEGLRVVCGYCSEPFGKTTVMMSDRDWDRFEHHVELDMIKKQMSVHGLAKDYPLSVGLRGVGTCRHGSPEKCRSFPNCCGASCTSSHGNCRRGNACKVFQCPYDHQNRPKRCEKCEKEMKFGRS